MPLRPSAYFEADISRFVSSSDSLILGSLTGNSEFEVDLDQRNAWIAQIEVLQTAVAGMEGRILLEFVVPRIGSRIDAVLISGPLILVIEFKVGAETFDRGAINQAWDYALDLKNFHSASHDATIVPVLVATRAHQPT